MMTHYEANELLAAMALDAVDSNERIAVEEHLAQCPRCQSEFDALREVAGALGNSVEPVPEGLWSGIAIRMYEVNGEAPPSLAPVIGIDSHSSSARTGGFLSARSQRTLLSLASVAAAVVAVLAFALAGADRQVSRLQSALGNASSGGVESALKTPGHRLVNLSGSTHQTLAQFVLVPSGQGYMVNSSLSKLPANETYQLWGIIGGRAISMGLMGRSPQHVTFTASGTAQFSKLAVTVEPSGGTSVPTSPIVASGSV